MMNALIALTIGGAIFSMLSLFTGRIRADVQACDGRNSCVSTRERSAFCAGIPKRRECRK